MSACGAAPRVDEENRVVAHGPVTKIGVQPFDQALAVMYPLRFDRRLETMRVAVGSARECRRQPALQPDERTWCDGSVVTFHRDHSYYGRHHGDGRRTHRPPAGRLPATS